MDVAMDIINVVEREWPLDAVLVAELVDALPTSTPACHRLRTLDGRRGAVGRGGGRPGGDADAPPPPCTAATRCTSSTT